MKKLKGFVVLLASIVLAIVLIPMFGEKKVKAKTKSEAVAWITARENESWAVDYDGVYGPQCVDLIVYYWYWLTGYRSSGNAYDYANKSLPSGWTYTSSPQAGDIAVWKANKGIAGSNGHVALVKSVSGSNFYYVDVNGATGKAGHGTISISNPSTFIHPNLDDPVNYEIDLNWTLDGVNVVDAKDFATADVYINGNLVAANATDYWGSWPVGTTYEIKNIKSKTGYTYEGVASGALSGKLTSGSLECRLSFSKLVLWINTTNFPDSGFRTFVLDWYDKNGDSGLSEMDIKDVKELSPRGYDIKSLKGIEAFKYLENLNCFNLDLDALDVSKNTALKTLDCSNNKLTSLDVGNNALLEELDCSGNELISLDLSKNTAVSYLICYENKLATLNISKCTLLTTLNCSENQLDTLDIRNNTKLSKLLCQYNNLESLDISCNKVLESVNLRDNKIITLDTSNNPILKIISARNNPNLEVIIYNNANLITAYKNGETKINNGERYFYSKTTINGSNYILTLDENPNVIIEYVPVTITKQPSDITVTEGEIAAFSVSAAGNGLKYLWQYQEKGNSTWTDWTSDNTASISVAYSASRNGMSLRCVVTDFKGNKVTSNAVTLTYKSSLKIITQPENTTVNENEIAYFNVKASGDGLNYLWQYKNAGASTWTDWTSKTTASISVAYSVSRNGMSLRCVVTDSKGNKITSDAATLTYKSSLKITTQPENTTVNENEIAYFNVKASGNGLKYLWQYQEKGKSTWTDWTTKTTASISVAYASYRNGMSFRCVVTDALGTKVTSNAATLTYKSNLKITTQPESTTVNENEIAYFNVKASGNGLKYLWQYQEKGKSTWTDWTTKTTAAISVAYASYRNGMSFRCVVTDSTGTKVTSNSATLTYKSASTLSITKQPANTSVNEGELAYFEVTAKGKGLKYLWQYQEKGKSTWTDWTSKTTAKISVAYASYRNGMKFRCVVTDSTGNKVTSNAATLTYKVNNTLTITKQPVSTSVKANELAYFSVTATGKGLTYKWQYKNAGESSWTTWSSKTTASISVAYSASRNGMSLRCIVTDADGNIEISDVAKLTYK